MGTISAKIVFKMGKGFKAQAAAPSPSLNTKALRTNTEKGLVHAELKFECNVYVATHLSTKSTGRYIE